MTNAEIGNRIKYARNLRGATLDDIAKKIGVAKSTIQRYEAGKITNIKLPVVEAIAIALNTNPAWVVGKSDDMELPTQKVPKIMQYYDKLNDIGKFEAEKRVEELTLVPKYATGANINLKQTDVEFSNEFNPYFTDAKKAREYLHSQNYLVAFDGKASDLSNSDVIKIANEIKKNSNK